MFQYCPGHREKRMVRKVKKQIEHPPVMWEGGHGVGLRAVHAHIALVCIFKALKKVSQVQNKEKLKQLL